MIFLFFSRVKAFCDVSFYISPAPVIDYNSIDINITIPDICKNDPSVEPALISWNPGNYSKNLINYKNKLE